MMCNIQCNAVVDAADDSSGGNSIFMIYICYKVNVGEVRKEAFQDDILYELEEMMFESDHLKLC